MSEDSSSDENWNVSATKMTYYDVNSQVYDPESHVKCWECGKLTTDLPSLLTHYKSHNIEATCHICKITFRRLISLSLHLENAHSPPQCKECHLLFMNVWELNKHAETHYMVPVSRGKGPRTKGHSTQDGKKSHSVTNEVTVEKSANTSVSTCRMKIKQEDGLGTTHHSLEYITGEGEDDNNDDDNDDDEGSTTSESDAGVTRQRKPVNSRVNVEESDGDSDSSSTDCSSGPPSPSPPKAIPIPPHKNLMCSACGRGPFRSLKLHHLHCTGVNLKYQCCLCRLVFLTEESLKEHQMPLYSCHVCGQVFSHEKMLAAHPCPKESRSRLVLFCPEAMPKVCSICKSFFTSEKTLSAHVTRVHVSVVSTKVRVIAAPSPLNDKEASVGVNRWDGQLAHSGLKQAFNGKVAIGETHAGSVTTRVKSSPSSYPDASPIQVHLLPGTSVDKVDVGHAQPTNQFLKPPSSHSLTPHSNTETTSVVAESDDIPSPSILALFENDSRALTKRTQTNWRWKATYPCRQCGAILRHASCIISHRYLHRGQRSHRCQCGRTFKHRLHLLRHCVQHAEAVSYICVSCGDTFMGARLLAQHLRGRSPKASCQPKQKWNRKCKMTFTCDCGLLFPRPSAYIWHQLKNTKKS